MGRREDDAKDEDALDEHEYLIGATGGIRMSEVRQLFLEERTQALGVCPRRCVSWMVGVLEGMRR